jgi:hypothetical protein
MHSQFRASSFKRFFAWRVHLFGGWLQFARDVQSQEHRRELSPNPNAAAAHDLSLLLAFTNKLDHGCKIEAQAFRLVLTQIWSDKVNDSFRCGTGRAEISSEHQRRSQKFV